MINKEILKQMGFVKGNGWDHEVWVYDGNFWVHYGGEFHGLEGQQISGDDSMDEFFRMFIEMVKTDVMERASVSFY